MKAADNVRDKISIVHNLSCHDSHHDGELPVPGLPAGLVCCCLSLLALGNGSESIQNGLHNLEDLNLSGLDDL